MGRRNHFCAKPTKQKAIYNSVINQFLGQEIPIASTFKRTQNKPYLKTFETNRTTELKDIENHLYYPKIQHYLHENQTKLNTF